MALHQNLTHRYIFNKAEQTIVHKFFDTEKAEKNKKKQSKPFQKGKWVSRSSIPTAQLKMDLCKCGGTIYVPDELPEIYRLWGICSKCGKEWKSHW